MKKEIMFTDDGCSIQEYKKALEQIIDLSVDADSFGLFDDITEEDIEKAKFFAAIINVLSDVPARRVNHIFSHKKIEFNTCDFYDEIGM